MLRRGRVCRLLCATSVWVVSPSGSGAGEDGASGVLPEIADCLRFRAAIATSGDGSGVLEVWVAFPGNNNVLGPGEFGGGLESERANMTVKKINWIIMIGHRPLSVNYGPYVNY